MVEHELPLPAFQAVFDRRCKAIIVRAAVATFIRRDCVRLVEILNGERTGNHLVMQVTWVQATPDGRWTVLSLERAPQPTIPGLGPPTPSDDIPTRPDLPVVRMPPRSGA